MNDSYQLPAEFLNADFSSMLTRRQKWMLIGAAIACCGLIWLLSTALTVPEYPGYSMSILQQPSPVAAIILMLVGFSICVVLGGVIARSVRFDAGLWCAAAAMVALSARGGPMRYVLMSASSRGIYLKLALEILLLACFFELAGMIQRSLVTLGVLRQEKAFDGVDPSTEPLQRKILATLCGLAIAALIILIFCQSDRKLQVTLVTWLASLAGASVAYHLVPAAPARWFWSIPLLCGLVGYVGTYFGDPTGWIIGEPRGFFAALARPLPLDYAGAGGVGALTGYWLGRWWQLKREVDARRESEPGQEVQAA